MPNDDIKATVREYFEAMNAHGGGGAAGLWAADSTNFGRPIERQRLEKLMGELVQIYDHFEIKEMIAEKDWVACRVITSGKHTMRPTVPFDSGIWQLNEPSGREFTFQHIHMFRIVDGKIKEHTACRDDLGAARQIGLELVTADDEKPR